MENITKIIAGMLFTVLKRGMNVVNQTVLASCKLSLLFITQFNGVSIFVTLAMPPVV